MASHHKIAEIEAVYQSGFLFLYALLVFKRIMAGKADMKVKSIGNFLLAGGLILLIGFCSLTLHKSGYCITKARKLTDDDKIRYAVEYAIDENSPTIRVSYGQKYPDKVDIDFRQHRVNSPYKNADDFINRNPECCEIIRRNISTTVDQDGDSIPSDFMHYILGFNSDLIRVIYTTEYRDDSGKIRRAVKAIFPAVNICGGVTTDHTNAPPGDKYRTYPIGFISSEHKK